MTSKTKGTDVDIRLKKKDNTKSSLTDIIIAPSNEGRMTPVKNAMLSIIAGADASLYPQDTHVRGDWKIAVNYLETNYPVVTLRVGNVDMTEKVYGRQIGGNTRGHFVLYAFSAHVWAEKSYQLFEEGSDEQQTQARPASEIADAIIDTLEEYSGDDISGIRWFDKVTARESEPERGPQRLTRFIIEGFVMVRRPLT
jgi:hypothetical protein